MTEEQIKNIKMRWVSHISMGDYHTSNYVAEGYPFTLTYQVSVPTDYTYDDGYKDDGIKRRTSRNWVLNGKSIRSYKKLIEELKKIEL
ncbi:MAG: hypothetical protein ACI4TK_10925 [Agathobacter sp.]